MNEEALEALNCEIEKSAIDEVRSFYSDIWEEEIVEKDFKNLHFLWEKAYKELEEKQNDNR